MISKKPTPKYILDARRRGVTYDEAIEKILEKNGVESYPIPIVAIAKSMGFAVFRAIGEKLFANSGKKRYNEFEVKKDVKH